METVAMLCLMPFTAMFRGYILSILWSWFIVSLFGLPELTIPHAIGLALIVTFLTHDHTKTGEEPNFIKYATIGILYPAIALLIGWIITWFM